MNKAWLAALCLWGVLFAAPANAQWEAPSQGGSVLGDPDRLLEVAREESARGAHDAALGFYVRAIALKPDDARVLLAAGEEALLAGDVDAAFGFLGRAATLDPRNARARAGYGRALTLSMRPKDALTLFDQAVRLGISEGEIAGDRGLARDLLGENRRAQRDYRLALVQAPANTGIIQRLALSLAISGDREAALAAMQPITRDGSNPEAFRTLAFIHALTGNIALAHRTAAAHLSGAQADAFTPFFARISLLNDEEKAAAVFLGRLPRVRMAQNDAPVPARVAPPNTDPMTMRSAAVGDVAPSVGKDAVRAKAARNAAEKSAQARQQPVAETTVAVVSTVTRVVAVPSDAAVSLTEECSSLSGRKKTQCESNARALQRRCEGRSGRPTAECRDFKERLAALEPKKEAGKPKTKKDESNDAKAKDAEADDACAGLDGGKAVQCRADAKALDRRCGGTHAQKTAECLAYAETRATAKKDSDKPKAGRAKTRSPERYWVQVASGKNKGDLPRAWAGVKTKAPALLGKRTPYTAPVGATNRLLVGPFEDGADARAFVNKLNAAGVSSFPWTSDPGEDVEKIAVK